jgi:cystathionine beta-lyase
MTYDFDHGPQRRGSGCVKWDTAECGPGTLPMWVADMDFRVAEPIIDALRRRVEHGVFGYTEVGDAYYEALTSWFERRHQWTIRREWVIYTTGVVPAISAVIKALTLPGDKVLIQSPVYNCFFSSIRNNGCTVEDSPLVYENGSYHIDFADFERKAADPKVRVFLLCNPHNPAGRVWTRDELERLNDICLRHQVRVIADEIHCELVLPGYHYIPLASISDACEENTIVCNSPSKSFNTAGLQIANIICRNPFMRERIDRAVNINETCDVNPLGVEAFIAAYNESSEWIDQLCRYLSDNYQALLDHFSQRHPQLTVTRLEGTYLVWVQISATGLDADTLTKKLLEEGDVLVNSGTMYGEVTGRDFIRINIACPRSQMIKGLNRISKVIDNINNTTY